MGADVDATAAAAAENRDDNSHVHVGLSSSHHLSPAGLWKRTFTEISSTAMGVGPLFRIYYIPNTIISDANR